MVGKKRLPKAGERVKVGRRLLTIPGVTSMADSNPLTPTSGHGELEQPADELSDELTRTVKAAYQ